MVKIKDKIQQQLCGNSFNQYIITVSDVIKGIGHLKHGKTDGININQNSHISDSFVIEMHDIGIISCLN